MTRGLEFLISELLQGNKSYCYMNRILTLTTRFISVCFLIFNKPHFESHRFGLVASAPRTCLLSRVLWDLGVAAFSLPPRFRLLTDD